MANKEARGTKRTCQSEECETRFYDLNRDPIVCPVCDSPYKLTAAEEEEEAEAIAAAPAVAPAAAAAATSDGDEVSDDDDALVSLEDADAELGADDDDEEDDTFLADDDDDDTGVGDIIGGVEKDDEES